MRTRLFAVLAGMTLAAAPARAQDQPEAVRPGMTEEQVRAAWGEPLAVRRLNDWTYMFYENGLESTYRYHDVVMLQGNQVVDAIVRAPGRVYAGQSSSPPDRIPQFTPPRQQQPQQPQQPQPATGTVTGVRVTP